MPDIVKARNQGSNSSPVYAPVYKCGFDVPFESIRNMPIENLNINIEKSDSILSMLSPKTPELLDISGRTVWMIASIGGETFKDEVTVVGKTNSAYVVQIGDIEYSVRIAIVRFITGTD